MSKIVDLKMSDEEYLRLLNQQSNFLQKQTYIKLLICLGASPKKAEKVANILTSPIAQRLHKLGA